MSGAWTALVICAVALGGNLLGHLLSYRLMQRYMRSAFIGFGIGLLLLGIGEVMRFAHDQLTALETAMLVAADLVIYGCASFLFFNFINAGESSIRIRILRELRGALQPLTEASLLALYNDRLILETRLGRMVRNRQVEFVGGRYRLLSPTLAWIAQLILLLKRLLLNQVSEFSASRDD